MSELHKALVEAQAEVKNPEMDAVNPHFRNRYASLKSCRDAIIPVFNKHGLVIMQMPGLTEQGVTLKTELLHISGEIKDCGTLVIPVDKSNAIAIGSALTYARRYSIQTVAGVVGDPDDDGEEASKPAKEKIVDPNEAWFKMCDDYRQKLGDKQFLTILGIHGATSQDEVTDSLTRRAIFKHFQAQEAENGN